MSIAVDPHAVGTSAVRWADVASAAADLHSALELAVAAAATSAGDALILDALTRFWSRWGTSVAARMSDFGLLGELAGEAAGAYSSVEATVARHAQ